LNLFLKSIKLEGLFEKIKIENLIRIKFEYRLQTRE